MVSYIDASNFAQDLTNDKTQIFMLGNSNKDDIDIINGIIDGLILRDDGYKILNGFIKQNKHVLSDEDLLISLEHACLSKNKECVKIVSKFIENKTKFADSYKYIKEKNISCLEFIESYIPKELLDKINNERTFDIENLHINFNININLEPRNYFNKVTSAKNLLDLE
jgi:hypothetical protein